MESVAPLRGIAGDEAIIDLDRVSSDELRDALAQYIEDSLRRQYPLAAQREPLTALATATATHLTREQPSPRSQRWGEFLVATLFIRYLLRGAPAADVASAVETARRVPRTLPQALDLDLRGPPRSSGLRCGPC